MRQPDDATWFGEHTTGGTFGAFRRTVTTVLNRIMKQMSLAGLPNSSCHDEMQTPRSGGLFSAEEER